jgi:hypothetical protein
VPMKFLRNLISTLLRRKKPKRDASIYPMF